MCVHFLSVMSSLGELGLEGEQRVELCLVPYPLSIFYAKIVYLRSKS
jgi:hypothetical protein